MKICCPGGKLQDQSQDLEDSWGGLEPNLSAQSEAFLVCADSELLDINKDNHRTDQSNKMQFSFECICLF